MDQFRTTLPITPASFQIDLQTPVLSLGSCFAHTMGKRLQQNKFQVLNNPFGVIFNPLSVFKLLNAVINKTSHDLLQDNNLIENNGVWYHYDTHSDIWATTLPELKEKVQSKIEGTHQFLQTTQVLILTLGTAYAYFRKDNDLLVANCHKISQNFFEKRLLTTQEIIDGFAKLHKQLQQTYPNIKVIVTVSPVRHMKDTLPFNQVSKATLRLACHYITEQFPKVAYFPSYELLLDDLRDYRFFAKDMIHPTQVAEDYIWDKFTQAFMTETTLSFLKKWQKIRQSLNHRAFHPSSDTHQQFLKKLLNKLKEIQHQIDVTQEIIQVETQLV